jgi:hypothetical protein
MNMQVMPQHHMQVMDPTGHTTVTWNPDNSDSVADARREFERLLREGYYAFRMAVKHENGCITEEKAQRIREFDPQAGKVLMIPQHVGG